MDKTYEKLKEMLEENLKMIVKKGDLSKEDLCSVKEATSALEHLNHLMGSGMGYSEGTYSHVPMSYGPDRSPVTGRYISGESSYGPHGNMRVSYGYPMGYSGHSIKDRMVAALEVLFDEAKTDHERQMISNTINRIHSEN